jgi:ParB family chromosome partitioning protein
MTRQRGSWIGWRGQEEAEAAIGQVIDRRPQPGEQVQQLADALIEDSPYQARKPFDDASVADLAQAMCAAGFQGVLIVRPHSDAVKRQRGVCQLVYGHRRRAAWRLVCAERGQPCLLPVVVREVNDAQLLTIGAQENLQRHDLDPVEEGQIVAWLEHMFFDKNQAEIGVMLGKSSDWVSVRSRIHNLPDALKERLCERPRAVKQMIELGVLYAHDQALAVELAERVVREGLTVETVRTQIREQRAQTDQYGDREEENNRRASATSVQHVTNSARASAGASPLAAANNAQEAIADLNQSRAAATARPSINRTGVGRETEERGNDGDGATGGDHDIASLHTAVAVLTSLASQSTALHSSSSMEQLLDAVEEAVAALRRNLFRQRLAKRTATQAAVYRLSGTHLEDVLANLHSRQPTTITLRSSQTQGLSIRALLCFLPLNGVTRYSTKTMPELFIAVAEAGHTALPITMRPSPDWIRTHLKLPQRNAALVAAFLKDLAHIERRLQDTGLPLESDTEQARTELETAVDLFTRMGMRREAEETQDELGEGDRA